MTTPSPLHRAIVLASSLALVAASSCSAQRTSLARASRLASLKAQLPDGTLHPTSAGDLAGHNARTKLPRRADARVELEDADSHVSVRFALRGAAPVEGEVEGAFTIYPAALAGDADLIHRVGAAGTEDFVAFPASPEREELVYDVDVTHVAGLRLTSNTLEMLDESGTPRLRVAPPYVVETGGARRDATLTVEGCAYDASPAGPWGRAVTRPGARACTVRVTWRGVAYPAIVDPVWSATGDMVTVHQFHAASLLPSGKVLVVGGIVDIGGSAPAPSAELFDPTTKTFAVTGGAADGFHAGPTATRLASGKVLVVGNRQPLNNGPRSGYAAIYDEGAGTMSRVLSPLVDDVQRRNHAAVRLMNGQVLIAGAAIDALVFDPVTSSFRKTANAMVFARTAVSAVKLPSGKVLLASVGESTPDQQGIEIYEPTTDKFRRLATPLAAIDYVEGTALLGDGKALVFSHQGARAELNRTSLLYAFDEATEKLAAAGSPFIAGTGYTLTELPSGNVLVTGGANGSDAVPLAAIANASGFKATTPLLIESAGHTATRLAGDRVLLAGGYGPTILSRHRSTQIVDIAPNARTCSVGQAGACETGFCVDGVCCDSACTGQCEACDVAGSIGKCVAVTGNVHVAADPEALRTRCNDEGGKCGARCDGVERTRCAFPAAEATCGAECAGALFQARVCDGAGGCVTQAPRECAEKLTCASATTCHERCTTNKECVKGFNCEASTGKCLAGVQCVDALTSVSVDGVEQACAPYRCDVEGTRACRRDCRSVDDCAPPAACDPSGVCANAEAPPPDGCTASPRPGGGPPVTAAAVFAVVACAGLLRRRARSEGGRR